MHKAQKDYPDYSDFPTAEARALEWLGRLEEASGKRKAILGQGQNTALMYNQIAWLDVCRGTVTEASALAAEEAVKLDRGSAHLHTQACVLTELGRLEAARTALLDSIKGEEPPSSAGWYAFGRIAEQLEEPAAARAFYAKALVPTPGSEDSPLSCTTLARRRLAAMDLTAGQASR